MEISLNSFAKKCHYNSVKIRNDLLHPLKLIILNKYKTYEKASRKIGCSRRFLAMVLENKRNPSLELMLKLSRESGIPLEKLIDKIYPKFKPKSAYITPSRFPIQMDKNLGSLVGHCFGDGYVGKEFCYTNKSDELIGDVIGAVNNLPIYNMTSNKRYHKAILIRFSVLVRDLLICAGAPVGNKVQQKTFIPEWVKSAHDETKASFLRSLYDDEASVVINKGEIILGLSKSLSLEKNLHEYLCGLKNLLESLGIQGISITNAELRQGKNGKICSKVVRICGKINFVEFQKKVNFVNSNKRKALENMINRIKRIKLNRTARDKMVLNLLEKRPLVTANKISKSLGMSLKGTLGKLNEMERRGLIRRKGNYRSRWCLADYSGKLQKAQIDTD